MLKLGSFNLLSGRSLSDGRVVGERLVESINQLDVDVLAVQEVDRLQPRSGLVDQPAVIAQTLGAVASRFAPTLTGTPGEPGWTRTFPADPPVDAAQYGLALISRLPVAEWHVLPLSPSPGRFPLLIPGQPAEIRWVKDEPRVAVAAVLQEPRITIACTHLSYVPLSNLRQLLAVRRWLRTLPGPQILMGDLNLPGGIARRITGWTPLVSSPSYPSPAPRVQLDHVLAAGLPAGSRAEGRVRLMPISDHRAVVVDLELGLRA